jgi:hypothetical protein
MSTSLIKEISTGYFLVAHWLAVFKLTLKWLIILLQYYLHNIHILSLDELLHGMHGQEHSQTRKLCHQQEHISSHELRLQRNRRITKKVRLVIDRFMKVSNYRDFITLEAFKKNMGILGLHCSQ